MSKIRIVADSTCDLSDELLKKYEVATIPLCIVMDDKSYYDKEEILPEKIYKWADANKTTPKTAAVAFDKVGEVLKDYMNAGDEIVFIGISTKMSTTCNVVNLFAQQENYDKIYVVDSKNLSTGIGLQVIKAAKLASEGKSAKAIVQELEDTRDSVRASFVVDTLTYLARGGRCNAVTALLANTLKLHPKITVTDGVMDVSKKYHGGINSALIKYTKDMEQDLLNADNERVFITHSGCDETTINKVKEYLESLNYFDEILITRAGGVISSHCGPGTLGVLYYAGK